MIRFIKDDPSELEDGIWLMPPLYSRTWQWIKRKVNFEEGFIPMQDGTTFHIHKGEHLTSVRKVSEGIGWYEGKAWKEPNPKTVSKILEWLEKNEYLEIKRGRGNREYTLICLSEREKMKIFKKGVTANGEGVGEGREQLADINKKNLEESKKDEEEKISGTEVPKRKVFIHPTLEQVTDYCFERGNRVSPENWYDHYTSNGWKVGKNPMKDWKAAVRTWEKNASQQGGGNNGKYEGRTQKFGSGHGGNKKESEFAFLDINKPRERTVIEYDPTIF